MAKKKSAPPAARVPGGSILATCQPLGDRVVIKVDPSTEVNTTPGGILLPTVKQAAQKPTTGVVVSVGHGRREGKELIPVGVEVGNSVLFAQYAGMSLDNGVAATDGEYLIVREEDILAIL